MTNRVLLNDTNIEELKPRDKPYEVSDTKIPGFAVRVRPTGTVTFLLSYKNNLGKSQTYTIGRYGQEKEEFTAKKARDKAEALRGKIRKKGKDPQKEKRLNKTAAKLSNSRTLGAYYENRYKPHHLKKRKPDSAKEAQRMLERDFKHLLFDCPIAELSVDDVEAWQEGREKQGSDSDTIRRIRAELESLLTKAHKERGRWRWISKNPLAGLEPIKAKSPEDLKPRFLSDDETQRLLSAMRNRDKEIREKANSGNQWRIDRGLQPRPKKPKYYVDHLEPMVILALKTGLRRKELFLLEWRDVEHDYSALNIRASTTKTERARILPLPSSAREVLEKWRSQSKSNRLIFSNNGKPFDNVNTSWKALLKRAEIVDFRWHDMRHDYASQLVIRNISIEKISKLLGHTSIKTTQIYAHLSNKSLADAVEVLN